MRTPDQLKQQYNQLKPKPNETEWMIEQLKQDIQGNTLDPQTYVLLMEAHIENMLQHVLMIMMADWDPNVAKQGLEDFAKFSMLDKLVHVHRHLLQKQGHKLYIPKKDTIELS